MRGFAVAPVPAAGSGGTDGRSLHEPRGFEIPSPQFPFESQFAEVEGCRVHYVDEGTGPVLLLLHGNPTWSFVYRKLIAGLRSHFRCVAPDYPGFGLSSARLGYGFTAAEHARVIAGFVDRLRLDGVTLVAQDWGGPIGLEWATSNPERVRALVLGNTWAWPLRGQRRYELFSWLMGGPLGRSAGWLFNGVVRFFLARGLHKRLTPSELQAYHAPFRARDSRRPTTLFPRELIRATPFLSALEARLAKVAGKPALLLWGQRDFAFRGPELRRFQNAFPGHKTLLLREAGHFWQEDAADEAVEAIFGWHATTAVEPATQEGGC